MSTDRLLVGFAALLPVPAGLAAALIGKLSLGGTAGVAAVPTAAAATATGGAGVKAGILAHVTQAIGAHPVIATVVWETIVAMTAVGTVTLPSSSPPDRPVIVAPTTAVVAVPPAVPATREAPRPTHAPHTSAATKPSPSPTRTLAAGPASLESVSLAGSFVSVAHTYGVLTTVNASSPTDARQAATFQVVAGLADRACYSFRLADGQYLRHSA